jgi:hypothetical protein
MNTDNERVGWIRFWQKCPIKGGQVEDVADLEPKFFTLSLYAKGDARIALYNVTRSQTKIAPKQVLSYKKKKKKFFSITWPNLVNQIEHVMYVRSLNN